MLEDLLIIDIVIRKKWVLPTFIILTILFAIAEVIFGLLVFKFGNKNLIEVLLKSFSFGLFIFLYFLGFKIPKWVLIIFLVLYSVACVLAGLEQESFIFYLLAGFYLLYSIALFILAHNNLTVDRQVKAKIER